jgi:hypothetical protein
MEAHRTRVGSEHGSAGPRPRPTVASMTKTAARRWAYAAAAAGVTGNSLLAGFAGNLRGAVWSTTATAVEGRRREAR